MLRKLIFVINIVQVVGDCGVPATHPNVFLYSFVANAKEGHRLQFECDDSLGDKYGAFRVAYSMARVCSKGKWLGGVTKCAVKTEINITGITVFYPEQNKHVSFTSLDQVQLERTRILSIDFEFTPRKRISFLELSLDITSDNRKDLIEINVSVNKYRKCVTNPLFVSTDEYLADQFICEAISLEHYNNETNDLPSSFSATWRSNETYQAKFGEIAAFQLIDSCGKPDLPQHSGEIVSNGGKQYQMDTTVSQDRYREIDGGIYTINCLYEGNWDNQLSELEPIVKCPLNEFDFNSSDYKSYSLLGFQYFNGTEVAIIGSRIEFRCNETVAPNQTLIVFCGEDGSWKYNTNQPCGQSVNTTGILASNQNLKEPVYNFLNIVVILAVVVIALILTIIFVSLFVWRKRLSKKRLELNDKYDDHFGHFEDREGKDDNYDEINFSDIPNTHFSQLNEYEVTFNYDNIDPEYIAIEQ